MDMQCMDMHMRYSGSTQKTLKVTVANVVKL